MKITYNQKSMEKFKAHVMFELLKKELEKYDFETKKAVIERLKKEYGKEV